MPHTIIAPAASHPAVGYSHGVKAGNTLYIAGQVAVGPDGSIVGAGDIAAQVKQVWSNLQAVLAEAGGSVEDIVKITVYATDLSYRPAIAAARDAVFAGGRFPASTFLVVQSLARPELLVEIEAVAVLGE